METRPERYVPPVAAKAGQFARDTFGAYKKGKRDNGREGYRPR
ncbi:hypothetical protein [Saccharothrix australiensis]|nr:hypothetical protein [Saccharothrix australiensis]